MLTRSYEIEIQRPISDVWAFLMDIRSDARWVTGVIEGRKTSPGPISIGTTFQYRMRVMGLPAKTDLRVIGHDEPTWHEVEARSGFMRLEASYSLQADGESTRLTMNMEASWPTLVRPVGPILSRILDKQWKANASRLKSLLESGAGPTEESFEIER